ncbi:hypothetical protein ABT071_38260, partial [Streptomyces sp. NPDC002506]
MPALMSRSFAVVGTAVVASLLLLGDPAAADNRIGGGAKGATPTGGSSTSDGTLSATAGGVVYDRSKNGTGNSTGPVTAVGNWTPPACWYAPKYSPAQFKAYV